MTLERTKNGWQAKHNGGFYFADTRNQALHTAVNSYDSCEVCEDNFNLEDLNEGLCELCEGLKGIVR